MYLRSPCKCLKRASRAIYLSIAIVTTLLFLPAVEAKTGNLSGVIFTVGPDHAQTVWPNARVTLKNLDTKNESATSPIGSGLTPSTASCTAIMKSR